MIKRNEEVKNVGVRRLTTPSCSGSDGGKVGLFNQLLQPSQWPPARNELAAAEFEDIIHVIHVSI